MESQPAILKRQRPSARYLTACLRLGVKPAVAVEALAGIDIDDQLVVGLGPAFSRLIGSERPELRPFPALSGVGVEVPSTQTDLWMWVNCNDRAAAISHSKRLMSALSAAFTFADPVDGFKNGETPNGLGRDLTGYEDGTENPDGEDATAAAIAGDGSSFVAVQAWKHDLSHFGNFSESEQDLMIGRRRSDNVELDDAPATAHVKRTAQESFDPEAFVLRRSLPWSGPDGEGLMFIAFGKSFDAYEAQMRRMAGLDDGIVDACFRFSRPISGGYYWCPPTSKGRIQLR